MSLVNTFHSDNVSFNPLAQQKKSRQIAGLVLATVLVLHGLLAWYLSRKPTVPPSDSMVIMEVALLQKSSPALKAPALPPPAKKEPIKPKPVVKPKPVKKPDVVKKPAPKPPEIKAFTPTPTPPAPSAPATTSSSATANTAAKSTSAIGPSSTNQNVVSSVIALFRVPPKYPPYAASHHIEGWVKVEFTVETDGSVEDAVVIESEPEDIFDNAAIAAINKWEFKEKIVNGVAVTQRAVQKLQFKLEH